MLDYDLIKEAIERSSQDTAIYVGCDSKKKRSKVMYVTTVVIHHSGSRGAMIFMKKEVEQHRSIYHKLQTEIYKAAEVASTVKEFCGDRRFEVHLDLNPNDKYESHKAIAEARGAILGIVGVEPKFKPDAFAASYAADRFAVKGARKIRK